MPAGAIPKDEPAGTYLRERGIKPWQFNTFGSRRGNHEVMIRGTFGNVRIRNLLLDDKEGGYTVHIPSDDELTIYDAAARYESEGTPLRYGLMEFLERLRFGVVGYGCTTCIGNSGPLADPISEAIRDEGLVVVVRGEGKGLPQVVALEDLCVAPLIHFGYERSLDRLPDFVRAWPQIP